MEYMWSHRHTGQWPQVGSSRTVLMTWICPFVSLLKALTHMADDHKGLTILGRNAEDTGMQERSMFLAPADTQLLCGGNLPTATVGWKFAISYHCIYI